MSLYLLQELDQFLPDADVEEPMPAGHLLDQYSGPGLLVPRFTRRDEAAGVFMNPFDQGEPPTPNLPWSTRERNIEVQDLLHPGVATASDPGFLGSDPLMRGPIGSEAMGLFERDDDEFDPYTPGRQWASYAGAVSGPALVLGNNYRFEGAPGTWPSTTLQQMATGGFWKNLTGQQTATGGFIAYGTYQGPAATSSSWPDGWTVANLGQAGSEPAAIPTLAPIPVTPAAPAPAPAPQPTPAAPPTPPRAIPLHLLAPPAPAIATPPAVVTATPPAAPVPPVPPSFIATAPTPTPATPPATATSSAPTSTTPLLVAGAVGLVALLFYAGRSKKKRGRRH